MLPQQIDYRQARPDDREWLFQLKSATLRDYVAQVYGWDDTVQRQFFDERFDPAKVRIVVAGGTDIGMLQVEEGSDALFVADIALLPEWQGRGIGTEVLRAVLRQADRLRQPVTLQVLRPNPARRLYQRLGFRVVGETAAHFLMRREPRIGASP